MFIIISKSHLLQMRGLKHSQYKSWTEGRVESHLLQMRGLKHSLWNRWKSIVLSHLLQMRGLKQRKNLKKWLKNGRIFYRCVDWNDKYKNCVIVWYCRIFYRCVDWNNGIRWCYIIEHSRIFYRCVDWNKPTLQSIRSTESHLLQMRGLKPKLLANFWVLNVASFTDAWIETATNQRRTRQEKSHLLQMRGLKQIVWIRNDKKEDVASFTDAWIETVVVNIVNWVNMSHLLQMRGLKHLNFIDILFDVVASFTDAWIETLMSLFWASMFCRIFYRCVDWNPYILS